MNSHVVVLSLTLSLSAFAAQVVKTAGDGSSILISQDTVPFKQGDKVCIHRSDKAPSIACGNVMKANSKGAIVKLAKPHQPVSKGHVAKLFVAPKAAPPVAVAPTPSPSPLASLPPETQSETETRTTAATQATKVVRPTRRRDKPFNRVSLGIGPLANWNFFIGSLNIQFAPVRHIAVGILPFFVSSSSGVNKVSDMGAFLTANYYLKPENFSGLWISAGAGLHKLHLEDDTDSEDASALSLLATVGYRARMGEIFQAGFSAGGMYTKESTTIFTLSFNGVVPIFLADIGVTF